MSLGVLYWGMWWDMFPLFLVYSCPAWKQHLETLMKTYNWIKNSSNINISQKKNNFDKILLNSNKTSKSKRVTNQKNIKRISFFHFTFFCKHFVKFNSLLFSISLSLSHTHTHVHTHTHTHTHIYIYIYIYIYICMICSM